MRIVRTYLRNEDGDIDMYIAEERNFLGFCTYRKIRKFDVLDYLKNDNPPYEPGGRNSLALLLYMMGAIALMLFVAVIGEGPPHAH